MQCGAYPCCHKRVAMVRQFREAQQGDYPSDLKNGLKRALQLFDEAAARQRKQATTEDKHHAQVFAWPFYDRGSDSSCAFTAIRISQRPNS